ncbi:hypothetical protein FOL47_001589 [Perkinsus chesapeaki]|uniref:Uncharacterized protein n=1 Tax=Perkinsus chesapeaki TaxID=330153 RepID=A0A7J6MIE1_PERCH|nr:hypothetical protein FOL47_001589 [Perkinsus chesapeaki]
MVIDPMQVRIEDPAQVYYDPHRDRLTLFYCLSTGHPGWDCRILMYDLTNNKKVGVWCTAGLMTLWCSDTHIEGMLVIDNHMIVGIQSGVGSEVLVAVLEEGQGATYSRSIWHSNDCVLPGSFAIDPYESGDLRKIAVEVRSLSDNTWTLVRLEKVSMSMPYVLFKEISKSTRDSKGHIPLQEIIEVSSITNSHIRLVRTYGRRDLPQSCRSFFTDPWMLTLNAMCPRWFDQMLVDYYGNCTVCQRGTQGRARFINSSGRSRISDIWERITLISTVMSYRINPYYS